MPLKSGAFTQARNLVPLHPDNLVQPRGMGAASYREIRPTQPKRNHRHLSEPVTYLETDLLFDDGALSSVVDVTASFASTSHTTRKPSGRMSGRVMRGSRVAAEKQHLPEPMTPPGEVAGMSFAPQAELVFVEDEFAPAGRRQASLGQKQLESFDASGTLFKGGYYTTYAARKFKGSSKLNSKAAYTLERSPSLLAEGVACATSEPLEDSLDTFHAEMSMSLILDDHYQYFSAKPKTNKAFGGITERMSGERSFLAQSSSDLPLQSKRYRPELDLSKSMSSRELAEALKQHPPTEGTRLYGGGGRESSLSTERGIGNNGLMTIRQSRALMTTFERPHTMASQG